MGVLNGGFTEFSLPRKQERKGKDVNGSGPHVHQRESQETFLYGSSMWPQREQGIKLRGILADGLYNLEVRVRYAETEKYLAPFPAGIIKSHIPSTPKACLEAKNVRSVQSSCNLAPFAINDLQYTRPQSGAFS